MGASADEREALLGPEEARRGASSDRLKQAQRACADTEELGTLLPAPASVCDAHALAAACVLIAVLPRAPQA